MRKEFNKEQECSNKNESKGNSKGRNRGNRNNKGRGNKPSKSEEHVDKSDSANINDSSYYYTDNTVLSQLQNYSFNQFGGVMIDFPMNTSNVPGQEAIPMVAVHYVNPCFPQTNALVGRTGVTVAGLRNFVMLSGSNGKTTQYAPQDVTLLIGALNEIIKMSSWCARALGCAYLFNYRNRAYPEALFTAMKINPTDFRTHLAEYRTKFNTLMAVACKIPFPSTISSFTKAANVFKGIYLDDANSALAQTYLLSPYSTWEFDEAYDSDGSGLKQVMWWNATPQNFSVYLNKLESMIDALLQSTTLNYIYSDVLRLTQKGIITQLITFEAIPETYVVMPEYNTEVELWVHNEMILGTPLDTASQWGTGWTDGNDVKSDPSNNTVLYNPQFKHAVNFGTNAYLDFKSDQVTDEDKVAATRLATRWTSIPNSGYYWTAQIAMLDLYVVRLEHYDGVNSTSVLSLGSNIMDVGTYTSATMSAVAKCSTVFDWSPIFYVCDNSSSTNFLVNSVGERNFYTIANYDLLSRIYDYEVLHYLEIK